MNAPNRNPLYFFVKDVLQARQPRSDEDDRKSLREVTHKMWNEMSVEDTHAFRRIATPERMRHLPAGSFEALLVRHVLRTDRAGSQPINATFHVLSSTVLAADHPPHHHPHHHGEFRRNLRRRIEFSFVTMSLKWGIQSSLYYILEGDSDGNHHNSIVQFATQIEFRLDASNDRGLIAIEDDEYERTLTLLADRILAIRNDALPAAVRRKAVRLSALYDGLRELCSFPRTELDSFAFKSTMFDAAVRCCASHAFSAAILERTQSSNAKICARSRSHIYCYLLCHYFGRTLGVAPILGRHRPS